MDSTQDSACLQVTTSTNSSDKFKLLCLLYINHIYEVTNLDCIWYRRSTLEVATNVTLVYTGPMLHEAQTIQITGKS
jgi:hypothetical protein